MGYSFEKIEPAEVLFEEVDFEPRFSSEEAGKEDHAPLHGMLNGLIISVPIWIVGYLIFQLI